MSDFDKEAEREKLRKKYERDKADREATQRMSDLLLKGATMTNMHCGTCGDPLFQQDGTTFCPSCHGNPDAVEGTDLEAQPADGSIDDEDATGDDTTGEGAAGADRPAADADTDDESTIADDRSEPPTQAGSSLSPESVPGIDSGTSADGESDAQPDAGGEPSIDRLDFGGRSSADASDDASSRPPRRSANRSRGGDLDGARESLVAALEKFAAEAAETDDPRYAKECLEAAREASETLDVLR